MSRGNVHVTPLSAWPKTRCGKCGETPDNDYHHGTTGDVSFVDLDRNDIVRHTLVARIVDAYAADAAARGGDGEDRQKKEAGHER